MHINELPNEVLGQILDETAALNAKDGVAWTYGLSGADIPLQPKKRLDRSVRGPLSADIQRWDSVNSVRCVCRRWHEYALDHSLRNLYLRRWRGSERWAELSIKRQNYHIYELINNPSGLPVYRDPYLELRQTATLFSQYPATTAMVQTLWFQGFFTPESESLIFKVLRSCRNLSSISIPWTMLRHGNAQDWVHTLGIAHPDDKRVESLELQAMCLPQTVTDEHAVAIDRKPLQDAQVDFGHLKRLKLIGNTTFMPVNDDDLSFIAQSATSLEEFHITSLSTVSIRGVMDIVHGAQSTLRVLEHSPRSNDGFFHPDPGSVDKDEHICETLISCPKLKDLSISMPSACSHLFSNEDVLWEGECQVRALKLCDEAGGTKARARSLRKLLNQARKLIECQHRHHRELDVELFFADCIFDPRDCVVHGDFSLAQVSSAGYWPSTKTSSSKGPYGSTGLYGKDEGDWELVTEDEFFRAVEVGWITI